MRFQENTPQKTTVFSIRRVALTTLAIMLFGFFSFEAYSIIEKTQNAKAQGQTSTFLRNEYTLVNLDAPGEISVDASRPPVFVTTVPEEMIGVSPEEIEIETPSTITTEIQNTSVFIGNANFTLTHLTSQTEKNTTWEYDPESNQIRVYTDFSFPIDPGRYQLTGTIEYNQIVKHFSKTISLGLVVLNTPTTPLITEKKNPLSLSVLDSEGLMVCDAAIEIEILDPDGQSTTLSTTNKTIATNPECYSLDKTIKPDFESSFVPQKAGNYFLRTTATTDEGSQTITTMLTTVKDTPYLITRNEATRLYPLHTYPVTIDIAGELNEGDLITETLPASFEIFGEGFQIVQDGENQDLIWHIDQNDSNLVLSYSYKAPLISPAIYLSGPLSISRNEEILFEETSSWQIAIDGIGDAAAQFTGTQTTLGTNLNQASLTSIDFSTSHYDDMYFTFDALNPNEIIVDQPGDYLVSYTIPQYSTVSRSNVRGEIAVNGIFVPGSMGQSAYIRSGSGHNESSSHNTSLLRGLSSGDIIEIKVIAVANTGTVTTDSVITATLKYMDATTAMFSGSATASTLGTNLNSTPSPLIWTADRNDAGYTHSNESITITDSGYYRVWFNIPLEGTVSRGNVQADITLDGSPVVGAEAKQGYIRNSNGHNESSLHFSGIIPVLTAGQTLQITVQQEGNSGTITMGTDQASIIIEKVDTTGLAVLRGRDLSLGTNWNNDTANDILYDTVDVIDTTYYSHNPLSNPNQVTLLAKGDYFLTYNDAMTSTTARANNKVMVLINGTPYSGAETKSHFIRAANGNNDSSATLTIMLTDIVAGDILTVQSGREATSATIDDTTDSILSLEFIPSSDPDITQLHYRFRDDSTDINSNSGWLGAEDTFLDQANPGNTYRLRMSVANTGLSTNLVGKTYQLEWAQNTSTCDAITTWTPASTAGDEFQMIDSGFITPDGVATNSLLSNLEGYTFLEGQARDILDTTSTMGPLPIDQYLEIEFSFDLTGTIPANTSYCLRAIDTTTGSPLDTYQTYPELVTASPKLDQVGYKFRDDTIDPNTDSEWISAENTPIPNGLASGSNFRLRMEVGNSGGIDYPSNSSYQLQFGELSTSCSAITTWTGVNNAPDQFDLSPSSYITDGMTLSSKQLSSSYGFVPGEAWETSDTTNVFGSYSAYQTTEIEYSLKANTALTGKTYCFRLFNTQTSTPLDTYSNYPSLLISIPNAGIRSTEYKITAGQFPLDTYQLTLQYPLKKNHFIFVRGSADGNVTRGADDSYARVSALPSGSNGSLPLSSAQNQIELSRYGTDGDWVGTVTVVECLGDCDRAGFKTIDILEITEPNGVTTGSATTTTPWTNLSRVSIFAGAFGAGSNVLSAIGTNEHNAAWSRWYPSLSNTITYERNASTSLETTTNTAYAIQWGSEWTVHHALVTGSSGGNGVDSITEYDSTTIPSVVRDQTFVWGTGYTDMTGLGDGAEGMAITLGDGVTQNANETLISIGSEFITNKTFDVYTFSHPNLAVDYRFKPDGDTNANTLPVTVDAASDTQRMALISNTSNGTGNAFPRSIWSANYINDTTIEINRNYRGQEFAAWITGIDFMGIRANPITEQIHFRIKDDTSALNADTGWRESEDVAVPLGSNGEVFRIRFEVANTSISPELSARNYQLEWGEKTTSCTAISSWNSASTPLDDWKLLDSLFIEPDGSPTSSLLLNNEGYVFQTGYAHDITDTTAPVGPLFGNSFTELEYSLSPTKYLNPGATYCFRVTDAGTPLDDYNKFPEITMASGSLSGIAYSDKGITPLDGSSSPTRVKLKINGVGSALDMIDNASGTWSIPGVSYNSGDILTAYLDDNCDTHQRVYASESLFGLGTYLDTFYSITDTALELTPTGLSNGTGTYTSDIYDTLGTSSFDNFSWIPKYPYGKELPSNNGIESSYQSGNLDMSGNVLLYHLNETTGPIQDFSGYDNNGIVDSALYISNGVYDSGMYFDGNTASINTPDAPNLDITGDITIESWIYWFGSGGSTYPDIVVKGDYQDAYDLWVNTSGPDGVVVLTLNSNSYTSTQTFTKDAWHHIAATLNGTTVTLYIDGVPTDTFTHTGGINSIAEPLWISNDVYPFIGYLDEIAVYDRALSNTDIQERYIRGLRDVKFQVRSCDDPLCSGESFVGPDGNTLSYFSEFTSPSSGLPSFQLNVPNNQYFQFQTTLETANPSYQIEIPSVTYTHTDIGGCAGLTKDVTTQTEFDSGTYTNSAYSVPLSGVTLDSTGISSGSGQYQSEILDILTPEVFTTLSWTPGMAYGKELPDNQAIESGYTDHSFDMTSNIALFHMNEVGESFFKDSSGTGNNGSCTNCPNSSSGVFNNAFSFDEVDDVITLSNLGTGIDELTLSFWVKQSEVNGSAYQYMFSYGTVGNSNSINIYANESTGDLIVGINDSGESGQTITYSGYSSFVDNTWHLITLQKDATGSDLYVDGSLAVDGGTIGNGTITPTTDIFIGGRYDLNVDRFFGGEMDEFSLFSRALTPTEIHAMYLRGILDLSFQIRSCDDALCSGETFIGPDGSNSTYYQGSESTSNGTPQIAFQFVPENQYIQFETTLNTQNAVDSPLLSNVSIAYGENPKATTVLVSDGSAISDFKLYKDSVIVRSNLAPITNADLETGKGADDDIIYSLLGSDLTLNTGTELRVYTGNSYSPGGNITTLQNITTGNFGDLFLEPTSSLLGSGSETYMIDGDVTIDSLAHLTAPTNGIIETSGNYQNSGTMTAGNSHYRFDGVGSRTLSGNLSGSSAFWSMEFDNPLGSWSIQNSLVVAKPNSVDTLQFKNGDVTMLGSINSYGGISISSGIDQNASLTSLDLAIGNRYLTVGNTSTPSTCPQCTITVGATSGNGSGLLSLGAGSVLQLVPYAGATPSDSTLTVESTGRFDLEGSLAESGTITNLTNTTITDSSKTFGNNTLIGKEIMIFETAETPRSFHTTITSNTTDTITFSSISVGSSTIQSSDGITFCSASPSLLSANNQFVGKYISDRTGSQDIHLIIASTHNDPACAGSTDSFVLDDTNSPTTTLVAGDSFDITPGIKALDSYSIITPAYLTAETGIACSSSINQSGESSIRFHSGSESSLVNSYLCDLGRNAPNLMGIEYNTVDSQNSLESLTLQNTIIDNVFKGPSFQSSILTNGSIDNLFIENTTDNALSFVSSSVPQVSRISIDNSSVGYGIFIQNPLIPQRLSSLQIKDTQIGILLDNAAESSISHASILGGNNAIFLSNSPQSTLQNFISANHSASAIDAFESPNIVIRQGSIHNALHGLNIEGASLSNGTLLNSRFGDLSANALGDIQIDGLAAHTLFARNTIFDSSTEFTSPLPNANSWIWSELHDGIHGHLDLSGNVVIGSDISRTIQDESNLTVDYLSPISVQGSTTPLYSGTGTEDVTFLPDTSIADLSSGPYTYEFVVSTPGDCSVAEFEVYRNGLDTSQTMSCGIFFTDAQNGINTRFLIQGGTPTPYTLSDTYSLSIWGDSTDSNTQKHLTFHSAGDMLSVNSLSNLSLKGESSISNLTSVSSLSGEYYGIAISGTADLQNTTFSGLGASTGYGIDLLDTANVTTLQNLHFSDYQNQTSSDSYIRVHSSLIGTGTPTRTFSGLNFTSSGSEPEYTITESGGAAGSGYWYFTSTSCTGWANCEASDNDTGALDGTIRFDEVLSVAPSAPTILYVDNTTSQSGRSAPIDLTDTTPAISAIFNDPDAGDIGNKARIQVSTDSTFASVTHWDSGIAGNTITNVVDGNRSSDVSFDTFGNSATLPLNLNDGDITYFYRIKFWDDTNLEGAFSAHSSFKLLDAPNTPTNPSLSGITPSSITLGWTDTSIGQTEESGFEITHSTDNLTYLLLNTSAADSTSYDHTPLAPNSIHYYKIRAVNLAGNSSETAAVSAYTLANTPGLPTLSIPGYNSIGVVIAENSNPADTIYAISISTDNFVTDTQYLQNDYSIGSTLGNEDFQTVAFWQNGSSFITIPNLIQNQSYDIKIVAKNGDGIITPYSGTAQITTWDNPELMLEVEGTALGSIDLTGQSNVSLGALTPLTSETAVQKVSVISNANSGYVVKISADTKMTHSEDASVDIDFITNGSIGTNANPVAWTTPSGNIIGQDTAFMGYHTSDTTLGSGVTNRFTTSDSWAGFNTLGDFYEILYNPNPASGMDEGEEYVYVTFKIETSGLQPSGNYSNFNVSYQVVPTF